jgi:predicted MFS family arabinose efflux permease
MDVPLVQSYTMAVIDPDERASVAGVVSMSKRLATVGGPVPAGYLFTQSLLALPFVIGSIFQFVSAGMYYTFFRNVAPPEETATT